MGILFQYLVLIAAFLLPWMIGLSVRFHRSGETRRMRLCILLAIVCAALCGLSLAIAFAAESIAV